MIAPRIASSGMQAHLAVAFAPDEPDRQSAAQLAACWLVADPAIEPRNEHVQLGLARRALQSEQQPVVERARVIEAVGAAPGYVHEPFDDGWELGLGSPSARCTRQATAPSTPRSR